MAYANGKVAFLNEKNWNNKTLYSLKLQNDNNLYMCGEEKPACDKGDFISFGYKEGRSGRFEVDVKSIKTKAAEVLKPGTGQSFGGYRNDDKRQETIEYQAARNSAIAAAGVILQASALKLPAKEADKYKVVVELIGTLTDKFFAETKTLGKGPSPEEVKEEAAAEAKEEAKDFDDNWE